MKKQITVQPKPARSRRNEGKEKAERLNTVLVNAVSGSYGVESLIKPMKVKLSSAEKQAAKKAKAKSLKKAKVS